MKKLNQQGSILINALVATVVIAIISGVILQQSLTTMKTLRLPRVKSVMTAVEGALRHSLLQPTSYTGCDSDLGITATCTLNPAVVASLSVNIPGCDPGPCGVTVTGNFTPETRTFDGVITYNGTEVPSNPRTVSIVVPLEVLQSSTINCPDATPIFTGFDGDGVKQCRALEGSCAPGTYLVGFDPTSLSAVCMPLPTGSENCGTSAYFNAFSWATTGASGTCLSRPLPTTLFPF